MVDHSHYRTSQKPNHPQQNYPLLPLELVAGLVVGRVLELELVTESVELALGRDLELELATGSAELAAGNAPELVGSVPHYLGHNCDCARGQQSAST